jgi:hypothetical protein
MKTIRLTRRKRAKVSDEDYQWLRQWKWHSLGCWTKKRNRLKTWYAVRNVYDPETQKAHKGYMHKEIANRMGLALERIEHRDKDGLNNQRENLRPATHSQVIQNQRKRPRCASRFKGVWQDRSRWRAGITQAGRKRSLGSFLCEEDAAQAYNQAARKLFGDHARLNPVPPQ